ncbi:VOC family protein [Micromonospora palythoicola]|uniref:VOC family protein n=1 Tax=Micromonospora palythoicola TaxID=3120507 RepID=UPI002FCE4294
MVLYRDIEIGRRFLVDVLGFEEKAVETDGTGAVHRVDLSLGYFNRVTIGQAGAGPNGPAASDGAHHRFTIGTNGWEVETLLERVRAAGAPVTDVLTDDIFGDCAFTTEDAEGNRWTIRGIVALTG